MVLSACYGCQLSSQKGASSHSGPATCAAVARRSLAVCPCAWALDSPDPRVCVVAATAVGTIKVGTVAVRKAVASAAAKNTPVLFVGGTGQLGIRIIRDLLTAGFKVTAGRCPSSPAHDLSRRTTAECPHEQQPHGH
jgi:hypothetical protein